MSYLVSWSGGKDCCFACFKAISEGYNISHLINLVSKESKKIDTHNINTELIQLQAKSMHIPLIQQEISWNNYTQEFKRIIKPLIKNSLKGIIFGDIYLEEFEIQKHKKWAENVCGELGVQAVEPLWGYSADDIYLELIEVGFKAIIVSLKANLINKKWLGQFLDKSYFEYLKDNQINTCGELGEFHTFVTDCPLFKEKINIKQHNSILRDNYWYLNILEYS
ncbi:MAG: diphthine--ammonia ligase [Promethearchaeota archaeon]